MALLPEINTKWLDYSNNSNHATKSGDPTIIPGRIHQALRFDGVGDFVTVSDHASIKLGTSDFSIALWLRSKDIADSDLLEKGLAPIYYLYRMTGAGKMHMQIRNALQNRYKVSTGVVNDGNWHHCVATIDRDDVIKHYIDGVYDSSSANIAAVGDISTPQNLIICDDSLSGHYYIGDLDEILIFNRVLESWEVKALYNQGAP